MARVVKSKFKDHPFLSKLLTLHSPPEFIEYEGVLPQISYDDRGFGSPRILTVVGSRDCSTYGKEVLDVLIKNLSSTSTIILSGLALGVDGYAHEAALSSQLTTIAIPGSGIDKSVIYPRSNANLAKRILANNGLLLSPYEPTMRATKWSFPARNELMAALCDAVLVIEAREKSGTYITVRHALEFGKPVGVVPGSIFSDFSQGCHLLLQDGAAPIFDSSSLFSLLSLEESDPTTNKNQFRTDELNDDEKKLLELLSTPLQKDALRLASMLPAHRFLIALTSLEIKGYIVCSLHEVRKVV